MNWDICGKRLCWPSWDRCRQSPASRCWRPWRGGEAAAGSQCTPAARISPSACSHPLQQQESAAPKIRGRSWRSLIFIMDQISLKTPNPKCRLFLTIDQKRYLAAGVNMSEVPYPLRCNIVLYEYMYPCTYSHREVGGGGRWTSKKDRGALVHKKGRKYQHDWLYLQSINYI